MRSNEEHISGFTIVELLVVIVVIAILATITAVSYNGVSQRANIASIQQQLSNNSSLLKLYNAENNSYPTALDVNNCPSAPIADTKNCLKNLSGATMSYTGSATTFKLEIAKGDLKYKITESGSIVAGSLVCPTGFIVVPGSATYNTNDFCVMKYEAKNDGTGKAVSIPGGYPWVDISQTSAITTAQAACANCHLITEAEWMTIAQNVLSVASNWSGGAVGSGFIYSGHNDSSYSSYALVADANDANGYAGTGNSISSGPNQRRTLTLTNGEVVWDMAGNVWEWTAGQTAGGQPGVTGGGFAWREWKTITANGALAVSPFPSGTGLTGASSWGSTNGIGQIYSSADDAVLFGFIRGGSWGNNLGAGILALGLNAWPYYADRAVGFRVTSAGL